MPCLLLSKLFVTVKEVVTCEVDLSGVFYCSNSEVALRWIRQQSKNRIADIRHYNIHFIGHMFHLILLHQTFPHNQYHYKIS